MKDLIIIIMAIALMVLATMPVFFGANVITLLFAVVGIAGLVVLDKYGDKS